jgi:transcription antitermination protein NusB
MNCLIRCSFFIYRFQSRADTSVGGWSNRAKTLILRRFYKTFFLFPADNADFRHFGPLMLNRRLLRIKVMQTLYALQQANQATVQIAHDGIADLFQPDLNSMEPQDKRQLEGNRKLAAALFDEAIKNNQPAAEEDTPKPILKAVNDGFLFYQIRQKKDRQQVAQQLIQTVQALYDDLIWVLTLLPELGRAAQTDRARTYHNEDATPFPMESGLNDNLIINALDTHSPLQNEALRRSISWANDTAFIRDAYREVLKADDTYRAYCQQPNHTTNEDQAMVQYVLRSLIFKHETIKNHLAEIDLSWEENSEVVRSLAIKTLKSYQSVAGLTLEPLTDDWDEDQYFLNSLFDNALDHNREYEALLADQLQNWDVERVAMLDQIILKLAVTELLSFPAIPTKVSINEYIELAKAYSTPKSGKFVNGVLDNLSEKLIASGQLRKSGRGLLDNK